MIEDIKTDLFFREPEEKIQKKRQSSRTAQPSAATSKENGDWN